MDKYKEYTNRIKVIFILQIRLLVSILIVGLLFSIIFINTTPFDIEGSYSLSKKTIPPISPTTRVETINKDGIVLTKIKDDLVYFTTKFPDKYDTAKVKITFQNKEASQKIELGFKDKTEWHYNTQIIDHPFFYSPDWKKIGSGPTLYQKNLDYFSVEDFLKNYKENSIIGTLDYELPSKDNSVQNYSPKEENTVIDTPLRGSHTMFVYLSGEPFYMKVTKQDLNWYPEPDVLEISIYKDTDVVYTAFIDDDGDVTDSKNLGFPMEVEIRNPGPELPEPGIYKIVFDTNDDTVITRIETNLNKIVFSPPIYPVNNSTVYPGISPKTSTTTLYTNSPKFTVTTYHNDALQKIYLNSTTTTLSSVNSPTHMIFPVSSSTINKVDVPRSDIRISGLGYYAFSEDSYFTPSTNNIVPINSLSNISDADYVISKYKPFRIESGYYVVERKFDLSTAVPDKKGLSWIIRTPGLKENGNEVIIKDIEVEYSKQGWWNKN